MTKISFAFFGTSHIAVYILDELEKAGFLPSLVIAPPDKPKGRGLRASPVPARAWAKSHGIPVHTELPNEHAKFDVCIVADFGKIIPKQILELPRRGFLNVHPSLLPRLRGASPIRTAILNDERETGVSIIKLDDEMDHGPLVAQKKVALSEWPIRASKLEEILMREGGRLLAQILPQWIAGEIEAQPQNHDVATFSEILKKEDGLINFRESPRKNLLKIYAYEGWPGTYAYFERAGKRIRVGVLDAHIENDELVLDVVKPEGKKEMRYDEFERSGAKPMP